MDNRAMLWLVLALALIVFFIKFRFLEYKYGLAAVAALVHDVLIALGIMLLVGIVAGIFPALRAMRLSIVDALARG